MDRIRVTDKIALDGISSDYKEEKREKVFIIRKIARLFNNIEISNRKQRI